jgi:hypothetical protein
MFRPVKGRIKPLLVIAALASLYGCAVYPQVFVNEHGDFYRCSSYGRGPGGMSSAKQGLSDCAKQMRAAGFIEVERAGAVGVVLKESPAPDGMVVVISRVVNYSPASAAGIKAGDALITVGGQRITGVSQGKALLFGEAGTPVDMAVRRGDRELGFTITRAPYATLFPVPEK